MKAPITLAMVTLALGALTACGSEYELNSTPGPTEALGGDVERGAPSGHTLLLEREAILPEGPATKRAQEPANPQWSELPSPGGAAIRVRQLQGQPEQREETFRFGGDAPTLTDVLFVVDGSSSMRHVVDQVRAGMSAISQEGVFPSGTRIGVMNMTPFDFREAGPLRYVRHRSLAQLEPGFDGLVSQAKLQAARSAIAADSTLAEKYGRKFLFDGCDPWFAPTDASPDGTSCLVAHTQIIEAPLGIEAGLTSVAQRILKDGDLFRPGAAVNIVFVSDTHDPGLPPDHKNFEAMAFLRPSSDHLTELVVRNAPMASVRLHAIAPDESCTGERFDAPVYHHAAEATGGQSLDICDAEASDYAHMMRQIALQGSRPTEAVLPLSAEAADVASVTIDGQPVGFSWEGRALILDGAVPEKAADVQVRYRTPMATPRTRTP